MIDLKTLIKNNRVNFLKYRKGFLYYTIAAPDIILKGIFHSSGATYSFPVPIEDIGDATFNYGEKAILMMRYIRKAQEEGTFIKI